jgi:orotate phosphoribosyltransferase
LNADYVIDEFRKRGALLEGHFKLTSGLHSSVYLQCALVLQFPEKAELFGRAIAEPWQDKQISLVASPAIGGLIVGHEVARALGARFIWTERQGGEMTLRRGFTVEQGERVLVVEDVVTTGGSTRETVEALKKAGADVLGAASIIDRSSGKAEVGAPRTALATLDAKSVEPNACELCEAGSIAAKPGSRA